MKRACSLLGSALNFRRKMFGARVRSLEQLIEKCEASARRSCQTRASRWSPAGTEREAGCFLALHTFGLHPAELALLDEGFFRLVAARENAKLRESKRPRLAVFLLHHSPFLIAGPSGEEDSCFLFGLSGQPKLHVQSAALRSVSAFLRDSRPPSGFHFPRPHHPLIRRFSGGGTVFLERENAVCTALVLPSSALGAPVLPRHLMQTTFRFLVGGLSWPGNSFSAQSPESAVEVSARHFASRLSASPFADRFSLVENDFCVEDFSFVAEKARSHRKVAGSAQSVSRGAVIQHTSFLWKSPAETRMEKLLLNPARQPLYRAQRPHSEFCSKVPFALKKSSVLACGTEVEVDSSSKFLLALHFLAEQTLLSDHSLLHGEAQWNLHSAVLATASAKTPLDFFRSVRRVNGERSLRQRKETETPDFPSPLNFSVVSAKVARELVARLGGRTARKSLRGTFFIDDEGRPLPDEVYRQLLAVNGIVPLSPHSDAGEMSFSEARPTASSP